MRIILLFATIVICQTVQLSAQDQKKQDPDEEIIVNKKYDEHGNLIEYDSTYTHQWFSDSTYHFAEPGDLFSGDGFPDLQRFMNQFFNDSSMQGMIFPGHPGTLPFDDDDNSFGNFRFGIPDSLWRGFNFDHDSLFFDFQTDSTGIFPYDFSFPGLDDIRKRFQDNFGAFPHRFPEFPSFKNDEQRKEWEELMQKHQKEMEDLQKRWKEQ